MEIGAPVGIDKGYRDRHLALKGWIIRFELHHFNNLLVCPELREMAVVRVGMCGRLAGSARRIVRERYPESPAFASVEGVNVTGHTGRHFPHCDRVRI